MDQLETSKRNISKFDYVRFSLCDINGTNRGVVVPARNAEDFMEHGVNMVEGTLLLGAGNENIPVPHRKSIRDGDIAVVPDLQTLRSIPWAGKQRYNVAEVLCESRWKIDDTPQEACPRYVLKKQLQRLEDNGYQLLSSFHLDYILLHNIGMKPLFKTKGYMSHTIHAEHGSLMFDMDQNLLDSGVNIESMNSKFAPGQFEVVLKPKFGIEGIDMAVNCKQGITELATRIGMKASFISKFSPTDNGVGAYFNHSLVSSSSSHDVLYNAEDPQKLSIIAYHWIAGILRHSGALTAFCCPTVNCYRRLFHTWTPGLVFWKTEDRNASLRVRSHGPSGAVLENRLSSGKSNPYLVAAATIVAGLDGIINKLECPPPGASQPLPGTLQEALAALEADEEFVKGIGEDVVHWYVLTRKTEQRHFAKMTEGDRFEAEKDRYL